MTGVEGTERVLRNVLKAWPQVTARALGDSLAVPTCIEKFDVAGIWFDQSQNNVSAGAFARTGLTDNTQHLPFAHGERDVLQRSKSLTAMCTTTRIVLADAIDAQYDL